MATRTQTIAKLRDRIAPLGTAERFAVLHEEEIYRGEQSLSGHGSDDSETDALRRALPGLVQRLGVRSVLDAPCGDCHWMAQVDFLGIRYIGVDCVPALISDNTARFPNLDFRCLDILHDTLPSADLILSRDLMIHLSNADVARALERFAACGATWLLASTFIGRETNEDIESGDFRPINLQRAPFDLPEPEAVLSEYSQLGDGQFADRSMALWRIDRIARAG